jgi:predicted nucleotidyltransferase
MGDPDSQDSPSPSEGDDALDIAAIRDTVEDHPVRLAVLFGSRVAGGADDHSDVDIVVEFDPAVDDRGQALFSLLADLSVALDRNDIDLSVVSDLDPRVGRAAFAHGRLVHGSPERADQHRRRFADATSDADRSLRERFDEAVDGVERLVEN